jgi:hypothetical protein
LRGEDAGGAEAAHSIARGGEGVGAAIVAGLDDLDAEIDRKVGTTDSQARGVVGYERVDINLSRAASGCRGIEAVQRGERTVPIADLDAFARSSADGMCRDYLRRTRPLQARVGNRVRLLATRGQGVLGWTTPKGQQVIGLPAWTDKMPADSPFPWAGRAKEWWGRSHAALDGPALTPTVIRLLELTGAPLPSDAVAAVLLDITGTTDAGPRIDASPEGDEPELAVLDAGVGADHLAIARRYLDRAWRELCDMPAHMRASLLLSLRDHHGAALLPVFHCAGVTPLRLVAEALAMKPDEAAAIWAHLPWDDRAIGRRLGLTGLQVLNARTAARSRMLRHMSLGDVR